MIFTGDQVFPMLGCTPQCMDHLLIFCQLVEISYRFLCMNCVKIWSFKLLIFKDMILVEHMQMNSCQFTPDFSDHTSLIPWFWTFSWLCASNVCTPFRCSYAFYAKIYNICSYQFHRKTMLLCGFDWHSRYSIWISTFVLLHTVWAQGVPVATKCTLGY